MRFVLDEVFDVAKLWAELQPLAEVVDAETAAAILEEAGKVTGDAIAPLNRSGDEGLPVDRRRGDHADGLPQRLGQGGWVGVSGDPPSTAAWACPRSSPLK